ncbi:MAG: type II toxin-antitoxin system ParD family antitoxin [Gammaproteobacteria bacterium]|nr:type II toxin-antitoxin system ParD family antitoxin [Gammaproteobacteria bacterium]
MNVRKNITLTKQQDEWIKAQIECGHFTNDSDYIRTLVRKDQEANAKLIALRKELKKGIDSGVSDKSIAGIWDSVEEKFKASENA